MNAVEVLDHIGRRVVIVSEPRGERKLVDRPGHRLAGNPGHCGH
jgi:hypothetical protein